METTLENKLFDFDKAKVQTLSLEQLERTHKENDVYGQPLRGIYHFQLLQTLIEACEENGYNVEVYDLFAAQNKDRNTPGVVLLPQVEAQFGERAVEAHILRRVFANIRITDFDDEEKTTNLAVAFHQKGVQVGFGNMVKICHNQTMLCADKYIATYGERGNGRLEEAITIPQVIDTVKSWLVDARHIIVTEREKIERMKSIEVGIQQMMLIVGMLTAIRVKHDTTHACIKDPHIYPLNQAQITQFTESLTLKSYETGGSISAWDLYNCATDLYKATSMDIPAILPQNRALVRFLDEQFHLD